MFGPLSEEREEVYIHNPSTRARIRAFNLIVLRANVANQLHNLWSQ